MYKCNCIQYPILNKCCFMNMVLKYYTIYLTINISIPFTLHHASLNSSLVWKAIYKSLWKEKIYILNIALFKFKFYLFMLIQLATETFESDCQLHKKLCALFFTMAKSEIYTLKMYVSSILKF